MAIFNRKKNTEAKAAPKKEVAEKAVAVRATAGEKAQFSHLLKSPRITEKAAIGTDHGVYVFNIAPSTTKPMVRNAIIELFKITPRKIRVTKVPSVRVKTRQTQKDGYTNRGKKAYVYLNKGDKLDLA